MVVAWIDILFIAAILLRVGLDIFSMIRASYISNLVYGLLFLIIGCVILVVDVHDMFGYISIASFVGWFWYGLCQKKNQDKYPGA